MIARIAPILSLLMLTVSAAAALAFSPARAQDDVPGLVQIYNFQLDRRGDVEGLSSGTGFVLNEDGYVATNYHVVEGGDVFYALMDGERIGMRQALRNPNAELVTSLSSSDFDLAVLKVEFDRPVSPRTLTTGSLDRGATVFALGYPGAADDRDIRGEDFYANATITSGVFARSFEGTWDSDNVVPLQIIQHSAEVSWGNSGGPVVDECERVIGVNTQISMSGRAFVETRSGLVQAAAQAPGVYFASAIDELIPRLDRNGIRYRIDNAPCLSMGGRVAMLTQLLQTSILGAAGLLIVMSFLLVIAFRRPRQQVMEVVARSVRPGGRADVAARDAARNAPHNAPQGGRRGQRARGGASAPKGANVMLEAYGGRGRTRRVLLDPSDLQGGGAVVGREAERSEHVIKDDSASRQHARFTIRGGRLLLEDLGSTNGTKLNGRRIEAGRSVEVSGGDDIAFGGATFRVVMS